MLQNLRQDLQRQAQLGENIKKCVTFISVSFGRATVLRDAASRLYDFEQLIQPLKSIAEHFSSQELLELPLLRRAINFSNVRSKLEMICTHSSVALIDEDVNEWT